MCLSVGLSVCVQAWRMCMRYLSVCDVLTSACYLVVFSSRAGNFSGLASGMPQPQPQWHPAPPPPDPRVMEKARPAPARRAVHLLPRPQEKKRPRGPLLTALPVDVAEVVEIDMVRAVDVDLEQLEVRKANQEEAAEYRAKRRRRVQADMYIKSMRCH